MEDLTCIQACNAIHYLQQTFLVSIEKTPSLLNDYPHLQLVLNLINKHKKNEYINGISPSIFEQISRDSITLKSFPLLFPNVLKTIVSHPDYPLLYSTDRVTVGMEQEETTLILTNTIDTLCNNELDVLEVGFGSGGFLKRTISLFETRVKKYIATDYIRIDLDADLSKRIPLEYKRWNIDKPFSSNDTFDVVVACNSLHTCKRIRTTLDYVANITKSGGYFILEEHISDMFCYFWGLDEIIWTTPQDIRSYGLWLSLEEWKLIFSESNLWEVVHLISNDRSMCLVARRK